jgi:hypothetical protein
LKETLKLKITLNKMKNVTDNIKDIIDQIEKSDLEDRLLENTQVDEKKK